MRHWEDWQPETGKYTCTDNDKNIRILELVKRFKIDEQFTKDKFIDIIDLIESSNDIEELENILI